MFILRKLPCLLIVIGYCGVESSLFFKKLYEGRLKIDGSYTFVNVSSVARCAMRCEAKGGCWLFTWDEATEECYLLNNLTSLVKTTTAPSTLITYSVNETNGKVIRMTPTSADWKTTKQVCQSMGGQLFLPPDNTLAFLLHHVFNTKFLWVGLYRYQTDLMTEWRGMDDKKTTKYPKFYPGEPNNSGGSQFYIALWHGLLSDLTNAQSYRGLCEV